MLTRVASVRSLGLLALVALNACAILVSPDEARLRRPEGGVVQPDGGDASARRDVQPGDDVPVVETDVVVTEDVVTPPEDVGCACTPGLTCCGAMCADLATDAANCGRCGLSCEAEVGPGSTCQGGQCVLTCAPGTGNCDGDERNGCETMLGSTENCGACGVECRNIGGVGRCTEGRCEFTCAPGQGNCDGNPENGCETRTTTNTNCGECGHACTDATGTCVPLMSGGNTCCRQVIGATCSSLCAGMCRRSGDGRTFCCER